MTRKRDAELKSWPKLLPATVVHPNLAQRDTAHWMSEEQPEFVLNQLKEFLRQ